MPQSNGDGRYSDEEIAKRFSQLARDFGEPTSRPAPPPIPTGPLTGPRDYEPPEIDESFVPPEPELSFDGVSPLVKLGWLGIVVGLLGVFAAFLSRWPVYVGSLFALVLAAGVVTLVLQLPHSPKERDDDGAVV